MSLYISNISIHGIKPSKTPRYAKVTFRGEGHVTDCITIQQDQTTFDDDFAWYLSSKLYKEDRVEVILYSKNNLFRDRLLGTANLHLDDLLKKSVAQLKTSFDNEYQNISVSFIAKYKQPSEKDNLSLEETDFTCFVNNNTMFYADEISIKSSETSNHLDNALLMLNNAGSYINNAKPRTSLPQPTIERPDDWQVHVNIINGKNLIGQSLDPIVFLHLDEKKEQTTLKKSTNNPIWNESFIFLLQCSKSTLLDRIFELKVCSGSKSNSIGEAQFDLHTVYDGVNHEITKKYVVLQTPGTLQINGYLLMSIKIIGGDEQPTKVFLNSSSSDLDVDKNLFLPQHSHQPREIFEYQISIFKGEAIVPTLSLSNSSMKKVFSKKPSESLETYVKVTYGNHSVNTKPIKGTVNPNFNEMLIFKDFFPPMVHTIKFELYDKESYSSDELLATHLINLDHIMLPNDLSDDSEDGSIINKDNKDDLPSFGPSWIHFYGLYHNHNSVAKRESGCIIGNLNRGSLLVEINLKPTDNKIKYKPCSVMELHKPQKLLLNDEEFVMFMNICDVTMIDKRLGQKALSFEITMGSHIHEEVEHASNNSSMFHTSSYIPEPSFNNIYNHVDFGDQKPSVILRQKRPDGRFRIYLLILLEKASHRFEDSISDIETATTALESDCYKVKYALDILHRDLQKFLRFQEDMSSGRNLNSLDRKMEFYRKTIVNKVCTAISEIQTITSTELEEFSKLVFQARDILEELKKISFEIQQSFPDVIIWMVQESKHIGYSRIAVKDIMHSDDEDLRGRKCGIVHAVFIQDPHSSLDSRYESLIKAKIDLRCWIGLESEDHLVNLPECFATNNAINSYPKLLTYKDCSKFDKLRVHIYQGRDMLGTDDTSLSDPFIRITFASSTKETRVIHQNNSPVFDETLEFDKFHLYGDDMAVRMNPPVITLEVFDHDDDGTNEFIGRCIGYPVIIETLEEQKSLKLQWFPVMIGSEQLGGILAAFELFESDSDFMESKLPLKIKHGHYYHPMPDMFRPKMANYRIELLTWGVREMKRYQGFKVIKPQITADFGYDLKSIDKKTHRKFYSEICEDALKQPNFNEQVHIFDCELPIEEEYMTTLTLRLLAHQRFNRLNLIGTFTSSSLANYICHNVDSYSKYFDTTKFQKKSTVYQVEKYKAKETSLSIGDKHSSSEETYDWWSRYYATEKDLEHPDGVEREQTKDEKSIIRLKIISHELEKDFGNFNDFLTSFPIKRGKDNMYHDANERNTKAVIKGAIRLWRKDKLIVSQLTLNNPKGTFQELPSNKPVKVLLRVYCIAGKNLAPKDSSGKSDPYILVKYGGKKYGSSDDHVANSINPEFGRCYEMEGTLPFDNMLTVQVYDWDFSPMPDDLIGVTKIDIENRYYSKYRADCGISMSYQTSGYASWRNISRPSVILQEMCKKDGRGEPHYDGEFCTIDEIAPAKKYKKLHATPHEASEHRDQSVESKALEVLHTYDQLPNGYSIVPEHVETRTLHLPDKPSLSQGELQMWVDIFPFEKTIITPAVDVSRRKPEEYELRIVVRNCEKVPLVEKSVMLGTKSSDIMIRGWVEGMYDEKQKTDIHYRSTDGVGMFNWRFIFPFSYQPAKKQIVHSQKLSTMSLEETEQYFPPILNLQCMEADILSADVLGDLKIPLLQIPSYYGKASGWSYPDYLHRLKKEKKDLPSIFKNRTISGWWPFSSTLEGKLVERGRIELEIDLVTKEEAEKNPVGLRRDEPQALEKPNRPEESMRLFLSPMKTIQLIYASYRWYCLKVLLVILVLLLVVLFIYAVPGLLARKTLQV